MTLSSPHASYQRHHPGRQGRSPLDRQPLSVLAALAGWPRRLLACALLILAVLLWLRGGPPSDQIVGARVAVLAATHDLGAGAVLSAGDVRLVRFDPRVVPEGALRSATSAVGRTVAGAVRRGEPITDVRLLGPGLTAGLRRSGSVAVPVRLADGETAALLRPGDQIDLLATPADGGGSPVAHVHDEGQGSAADAVALATGVRVLAVLVRPDAVTEDGVVVLVATAEQTARRLAGMAAHVRVSVALRPP